MMSSMSGLLEAINRVNNNGKARWERLKKGERGSKESKKVNVRNRKKGKKRAEVEKKCPRCRELDKCIPLKKL